MQSGRLIVALCLAGVVVVTLPLWLGHASRREDFASATSIVVRDIYSKRSVTISDPGTVQAITGAIKLEPKERCMCDHSLEADFKTASGVVSVSFCDHCFDVAKPGLYTTYEMPPAVYSRLKPYVDKIEAKPLSPKAGD